MSKTSLCTFFVDDLLFGLEVSDVQEVLRAQQMTDVPLAPKVVRGLMNLRGQIVTALDMRKQLDLPPPAADAKPPMNVLVRTDGALLSLLVDQIGDVIDVHADQFEMPPESVPKQVLKLINGVYKLEHQLLLLLNIDGLRAEQLQINQGSEMKV